MPKSKATSARAKSKPTNDVAPGDLRTLTRIDWNGLSFEQRRDAAEVLHALAYAIVGAEPKMLAALRVASVAETRKRREHVGASWNEATEKYDRSPLGVVTGGPVYSTYKQTEEIDAMVAGVQLRMRGPRGWANTTHEECARHVAMYLIRGCVCLNAPSILPHVPGSDGVRPHAHVLAREPAAIKATLRSLMDHRENEWADDEVVQKIIGVVLKELKVPRTVRKQALDSRTKRGRRTK